MYGGRSRPFLPGRSLPSTAWARSSMDSCLCWRQPLVVAHARAEVFRQRSRLSARDIDVYVNEVSGDQRRTRGIRRLAPDLETVVHAAAPEPADAAQDRECFVIARRAVVFDARLAQI